MLVVANGNNFVTEGYKAESIQNYEIDFHNEMEYENFLDVDRNSKDKSVKGNLNRSPFDKYPRLDYSVYAAEASGDIYCWPHKNI